VLTARAAGSESVGAHVRRVDVDLDRVIDLGVHKQRGERRVAATRRVKRAFAHQAVHAGFGAQQTKRVFAFDLDGRTLDACGVARGFVFDSGLEALAFGVFEVLAQQHAGPVAGLCATRASLDVDEAVERIGLVPEHAAKFEVFDELGQLGGFRLNGHQAIVVAFFLAHLKELKVVSQLAGQVGDGDHHTVQGFFLFAQFLGFFGVIPDRGIFE